MKSNLLYDAKTAATVFGVIRKARKDGQEVRIRQVKEIPVITGGIICTGFYNTGEGAALSGLGRIADIAQKTFNALQEDERKPFLYLPKDGEYIRRYQYWRSLLSPVLTLKQCNKAMCLILRWYIRIKQKQNTVLTVGQPSKSEGGRA